MTSDYRYFMRDDGGQVVADADPDMSWYEHKSAVEVQVVPVDAIVIRRNGAVAAPYGKGRLRVEGETYNATGTPEWYEQMARGYALIAEYLREHPPVDETQVKALADVLDEIDDPSDKELQADWRVVARRLVERGVRVEAKPNEQG